MNKTNKMKVYSTLLIFSILLLNTYIYSQTIQSTGTLTLKVTGFSNNIGQAIAKVFRKEDKIPNTPFMQVYSTIENKESVIVIKNLAYGEYAIIVVHDQNSNGTIDHSWGFPSEPLGFTNNWKLGLFSGMPTFEKLKFIFSSTKSFYTINVK